MSQLLSTAIEGKMKPNLPAPITKEMVVKAVNNADCKQNSKNPAVRRILRNSHGKSQRRKCT